MDQYKVLFLNIVCLLLLTGHSANSQGLTPVSATGHVVAEIVPVFSASETSQLNFGKFSPGPEGGKIILAPENTISVLGSIYKAPGFHNVASFHVSGDVDAAYSITLPGDPVILQHVSEAKTMTVGEWRSVPSPGPGAGMLSDGFQVVYIGATLNVGNFHDNPVGVYTGTYTVTFDFN